MPNLRKGVPAGWHWRDGRPRWVPSPTLRRGGWRGWDLKSKGAWMPRGPSIDAAQAICAAVAAWRAGRPVPDAYAPFAPAGACAAPAGEAALGQLGRRTLGGLIDAYQDSREFKALAAKTQQDRRSKLSRFVDVLAGHVAKPPHGAAADVQARYRTARARVRAFMVDVLEPPTFEAAADAEAANGPLYGVYWKLHDQVGKHMAHGVLAEVSAWLSWCVDRRAVAQNWAGLVDRAAPPGRIRIASWAELAALIEAAETLGLFSIADAVILGVDLSWSQVDRLKLTWAQVSADGRVKGSRQKTGRTGETPLLDGLGKPRIAVIQARQKEIYGEGVQPTHVLICEDTGQRWKPDWYRHRFADVRAAAAKTCPSVATLRDQDLRDTAITVCFQAGLDHAQIASRSLHSLKRIADVLDKHYAEIGQEIADAGAVKLNAYLAGKGAQL